MSASHGWTETDLEALDNAIIRCGMETFKLPAKTLDSEPKEVVDVAWDKVIKEFFEIVEYISARSINLDIIKEKGPKRPVYSRLKKMEEKRLEALKDTSKNRHKLSVLKIQIINTGNLDLESLESQGSKDEAEGDVGALISSITNVCKRKRHS